MVPLPSLSPTPCGMTCTEPLPLAEQAPLETLVIEYVVFRRGVIVRVAGVATMSFWVYPSLQSTLHGGVPTRENWRSTDGAAYRVPAPMRAAEGDVAPTALLAEEKHPGGRVTFT